MKSISVLNCIKSTVISLALFTIVIIFTSKTFAQKSRMTINPNGIVNKNLYGIDYMLKEYDFSIGDSTILTHIDLSSLEQFRQLNDDVEIFIPEINQTVILYSTNKSFTLKNERSIINN